MNSCSNKICVTLILIKILIYLLWQFVTFLIVPRFHPIWIWSMIIININNVTARNYHSFTIIFCVGIVTFLVVASFRYETKNRVSKIHIPTKSLTIGEVVWVRCWNNRNNSIANYLNITNTSLSILLND